MSSEFEDLAREFAGEIEEPEKEASFEELFTVNNPDEPRESVTASALFTEHKASTDDEEFYAKGAVRTPMIGSRVRISDLLELV